MNKVEVSVVLPVFQDLDGLSVTLKTIFNQSLEKMEILIIDDGNSEIDAEKIERLSKLDKRVRILKNDKNLGIAASLARGCEVARAPFIARIDNMDLMVPRDRLEKQLAILAKDKSVSIIGGNMEVVDCLNYDRYRTRYRLDAAENPIVAMKNRPCFSHPTVMFSKKKYDEVGGYDQKLAADEDYDLWYRMLQSSAGLILDDVFVIATMRKNSISVENNNRQIWMKIRRIWREEVTSRAAIGIFRAAYRLGLELPKFLVPIRQRVKMRYRRWHEYLGPIAPEDVASLEALYRFYEREGYFRGGAEIKSKSPALTHDAAALRQISP